MINAPSESNAMDVDGEGKTDGKIEKDSALYNAQLLYLFLLASGSAEADAHRPLINSLENLSGVSSGNQVSHPNTINRLPESFQPFG